MSLLAVTTQMVEGVTGSHQEVMRYWARLMLTGVPVMVTWRSLVPSSWLPILIWAPDTCRISLILVPWRPMIEPISCGGTETSELDGKTQNYRKHPKCLQPIKALSLSLHDLLSWWNGIKGKQQQKNPELLFSWPDTHHFKYCSYIACLPWFGHPSSTSSALFTPSSLL